MIEFEKLGYIDITKDFPIHFVECFGESFSVIYPYKQRLYKEEDGIGILLLVGQSHNTLDISGICYGNRRWQSFEIHSPCEDFNKIVNAAKDKILKHQKD